MRKLFQTYCGQLEKNIRKNTNKLAYFLYFHDFTKSRFAGLAVVCDGVVIDTSAMKGIDIDPETATAWIQAGVTVKELDDVTCPQGLAAVNGSCTDVGVIGLTLGGGFGFLSRTQGLAVDNCLTMEVVTATGQRIVASAQEHEQLFWALRGAGQVGYGVVTKAQVKLHKIEEKYVGGK